MSNSTLMGISGNRQARNSYGMELEERLVYRFVSIDFR